MGDGVRRTSARAEFRRDVVCGDFGVDDLLIREVCAGLFDGRSGLRAVEGVEAASDLASEFDVGDLVLADGNEVGLVEEDVGGLEERVAEKPVGVEVFLAELLLLVFVGGDALEPGERGEHAE